MTGSWRQPVKMKRKMELEGSAKLAISRGIRLTRLMQGLSQKELADRSGVGLKTLYRVEAGESGTSATIRKICFALGVTPEQLRAVPANTVGDQMPYGVHYGGQEVWTYPETTRRGKPTGDEMVRIQDPKERLRLSQIGFIPLFFAGPRFIMPEGPEVLRVELYSRNEGQLNAHLYRECIVVGVRGRFRCQLGSDLLEIGPGDVLGTHVAEIQWFEPLSDQELPVLFTWVGGVRHGILPTEDLDGARVRKGARE